MFRALIVYGIAAFAVLQIIEPIMHGLHWPDEVLSYVVVALGIGFPIVVGFAWVFDVNEGRIERTAGAPSSGRGRIALALAGVGVLAAAPGLVWYFVLRARPGPAAPAPVAPSIAVLPFVNLSSDKEQDYFSDGLSEELLDLLAKVPGLRVAARTSAFAFKGKNENIGEIAEKLHVKTVLEGSVRKAGDQIRVSAQLIEAAGGYHLWSETYERKVTDVFALQDDIARAVVGALKLRLLAAPTSKDRRTANTEAYNEYLLGKRFFHLNNIPGFLRAVQAYEKSVALDPGYAPAWAGLALSRFWYGQETETVAAVREWQERALAAADKAIALGLDLPDGFLARGFIRSTYIWDWEGARRDLDRAVELDPEDAEVLSADAALPRALGKLPKAIALFRKATDLDPLNARTWSSLGSTLIFDGQLAPARAALERSLEISPEQNYTAAWLAVSFLLDGHPAKALETSQRASHEVFRLQGAAFANHDLGRAKESQQALDQLTAKYSHDAAYQIATGHAWRGDKERAFEWLERAFQQHDGGLSLVKVDPMLRKIRGDPRYSALLEKMNIPRD